jgi:hypothetical protein
MHDVTDRRGSQSNLAIEWRAMKRSVRARALRTGRNIAGFTALGIGIPLLILPGPGTPFILAGLALLEPQHHWAGRLRTRCQSSMKSLLRATRRKG